MSKQIEAIKLAIEVFDGNWHDESVSTEWADKANNTLTALREALVEQPAQQEPVEVQMRVGNSYWAKVDRKTPAEQLEKAQRLMRENPGVFQMRKLYTTPQPAQQDIPDLIAGALGVSRGTAYDLMREALAEQPRGEATLAPAPGFCKNCKDYTIEAPLAEQPAQQEPVAWTGCGECDCSFSCHEGMTACIRNVAPGFTTPQPPRAVGTLAQPLTDEEIKQIHWSKPMDEYEFARAIEAAHGITSGSATTKGNT